MSLSGIACSSSSLENAMMTIHDAALIARRDGQNHRHVLATSRSSHTTSSSSIMDMDGSGPSRHVDDSAATRDAAALPRHRPANDPYANSNFPPPPAYYREFTTERWSSYKGKEKEHVDGLDLMRPPVVDWIEEEGTWMAFGEEHSVRFSFRERRRGGHGGC
jgi:hypothetical protein